MPKFITDQTKTIDGTAGESRRTKGRAEMSDDAQKYQVQYLQMEIERLQRENARLSP